MMTTSQYCEAAKVVVMGKELLVYKLSTARLGAVVYASDVRNCCRTN